MRHFRTIFISDLHLGNRNCQARELIDFLTHTESDQLYLLGDIIDLWKLGDRKGRWRPEHQQVLDILVRKARAGTRVCYIPGNHDPFFRNLQGESLGPIEIHRELVFQAHDGRRLLLIHGDQFDGEIVLHPFWQVVGDLLYESCSTVNRWLNQWRARQGMPFWSLANALKIRSKKARYYVRRFERRVIQFARERGVDGVICGHIHQAKLTEINGLVYGNDGDWMESCSGLVETASGDLELISWSRLQAPQNAEGAKPWTLLARLGARQSAH